MLVRDRAVNRPVQLGPYPFESLPRDPAIFSSEAARPFQVATTSAADGPMGPFLEEYTNYFRPFCEGDVAETRAPVSDDIRVRTGEIKGAAYYLDASHVGITAIPDNACSAPPDENLGVVIAVAHGTKVESDNLASTWLDGCEAHVAGMRSAEIAACIAGHIRALGYQATAHFADTQTVDLERLAICAGLAVRDAEDLARSPFLGHDFALAVVSTDYPLTCDTPLAADAKVPTLRYWWGINGAVSGREHRRRQRRASHMSQYPMEQVARVERPTTLIFDDEVPRVPKRAEFFQRSRMGDLGEKAAREVQRFALKHPLTHGMIPPLRSLVPHQYGEVASDPDPAMQNAEANTRAIKSLSYHLGADLTGICEVPRYAWYSHNARGEVIEPARRFAVVMLIDQGYDTMEGASGDDWISGCQSMRGYLRGAEIAGVMAAFLRARGFASRAETNADSEVLQIPLVLLAGLGELSRIGELVLNPYVGPRFKSVVLTTDLPLIPDQPIDFGLQDFCNRCLKCARECPVNAIPFGDKVIFNGYEIWKPDVERCTRYRVTNPKGSACGRCMKTCPLNKVVTTDGALVHRLGTWLGVNARWLKPLLVPIAVYLDDALGFGRRNPVKRWWQDLEIVNGAVRKPKATNERDIDVDGKTSAKRSPVGYYHAADMPPGNSNEPVAVDHKAAIRRAEQVETVEQALARRAAGGAKPEHYIPTKAID